MKNKIILFASSLGLAFLVGCASYEAHPIVWSDVATTWTNASPTVNLHSCADAVRVALVGNPDVNALRLACAQSKEVARETGWWEDPSLDVDLRRIIQSSANPFLGGSSLSFSIPLSGWIKHARTAAHLYAQADEWRVREAERACAVSARAACIQFQLAQQRLNVLLNGLTNGVLVQARAHLQKLTSLGELSSAQEDAILRQTHALKHQVMEVKGELITRRSDLLRVLGLAPTSTVQAHAHPPLDLTRLSSLTNLPSPLALCELPRVKAACAQLDGQEEELKREIQKQYPDLKMGPGYTREDGQDRVGFVLGLDLPLWNRNRLALAQARGAREKARLEALQTWQTLVQDDARARTSLAHLLVHHPPHQANEQTLLKLFQLGELDVTAFLSAHIEIIEAQLTELKWEEEVRLAVNQILRTTVSPDVPDFEKEFLP